MLNKNILFSGIQPTGNIHLGNYLGAIANWKKLQNEYNSIFSIVDLHAITLRQDPKLLHKSIIDTAIIYIACGIDHNKSIIFQQSAVKEHSELAWLLACNTQMGWLNRMTQFKDKAGKDRETALTGLYFYPILMAADILLYNTDIVPVGEDQKQHIELTRDIALSFNRYYDVDFFKIPEPMIKGVATRIMSLRDGTKKMSKSDISDYSRINLTDDPELIRQKLKKAKTDAIETILEDVDNRAEVKNLLNIYAAILDVDTEIAKKDFQNCNFSKLKEIIAEAIISKTEPIRQKILELQDNQDVIIKILEDGANKAKEIANTNINQIKKIIGIAL